jgi:hypothetical protein
VVVSVIHQNVLQIERVFHQLFLTPFLACLPVSRARSLWRSCSCSCSLRGLVCAAVETDFVNRIWTWILKGRNRADADVGRENGKSMYLGSGLDQLLSPGHVHPECMNRLLGVRVHL